MGAPPCASAGERTNRTQAIPFGRRKLYKEQSSGLYHTGHEHAERDSQATLSKPLHVPPEQAGSEKVHGQPGAKRQRQGKDQLMVWGVPFS